MKIFFITAFPPNKKTAGQNYTRQLLNDLGKVHTVDLIYWEYPTHEIDISPHINVLKAIKMPVSILPRLLAHFEFPLFTRRYNKSISKYISSIALDYDMVYFDFSQVFRYSIDINHDNKIGMCHDVIAQKYSRHSMLKHLLPWIWFSEQKCINGINHIYTFSKKDSDYIENHYNRHARQVSFYIDPLILNLNFNQIHVKDYFVMYGAWNRTENQESIQWCINNNIFNGLKIKIIGGGMPDAIINKLSNYTNIEYCGFVENPYIIIASSKGLIAPLFHGAGVKVKAIESLSLGTPVIGTNITFEGIENIPFRRLNALINISDNDLKNVIDELKSISIGEKTEIRNRFISTYGASKFIDQLKTQN